MDVAQKNISTAPHGTVVLCEKQERGQGRLSRQWVSPIGGVYLSVILHPPMQVLSQLTILASLATADAIHETCGLDACFKWPNDVMLHNKKVSGIIARSGQDEHGKLWAVVGIGINANMMASEQPAEIVDTAVSLSQITGCEVLRHKLIISLLQNFERRYNALIDGGLLWHEWKQRLVTLGERVTVKSGAVVYEGLAEAINADGALLLREQSGELIVIPAGDVTLKTRHCGHDVYQ